MLKQGLIIVIFTQFLANGLLGQYYTPIQPVDSINYDLFVDDELIGEFCLVKKMDSDSTILYTAKSNVDYRILFSFHISFIYSSSFSSDGRFKNSEFTYLMNDDVKEENWINCMGQKCYVYEKNEVKKVIDNSINVTGVQLYFNEPVNRSHVFSERYCDLFDLEKEGDQIYKVDFPGGSTNRYHYKDGYCYKVEISSLFSDMEFRLRGL